MIARTTVRECPAKHHVVEPFELPAAESAPFWGDVMIAAAAVSRLVSPVKINYEIHGTRFGIFSRGSAW
jgi:hypothetical protein